MTIDHSVGGKFSLPIDGTYHQFKPPRPDAEDAFRQYEGRLRVFGDSVVSEFKVSRGGAFLWREVTTYTLDPNGNLAAKDEFFSGEPPRLQKTIRHVFERQ